MSAQPLRLRAPGVYPDVSHADYHADLGPEPSLSASTAHTLLIRSPAHARHEHPRLNPAAEPRAGTRAMNDGSVLHDLMLGGGAGLVVIEAADYRTKAAQRSRDEAVAAGKTPILVDRLAELRGVAAAIWHDLAHHPMFAGVEEHATPGLRECTMLWRSGPAWCRARPDWMHAELGLIADFKFSGVSALDWWRGIAARGDDLRAAHYLAGMRALHPKLRQARYLFIVIETKPPHGLVVYELDAESLEVGAGKQARAVATWTDCIRHNRWPAYPQLVCQVGLSKWALGDWHEREAAEALEEAA